MKKEEKIKKLPFAPRVSTRKQTDPELFDGPKTDLSIPKKGPGQYRRRGEHTKEELIFKALEMFKNGVWESEIKEHLKRLIGPDHYKDEFNLNHAVGVMCATARDIITNAFTTKTTELIWVHSERYQKQINKFKNVDFTKLDPEEKMGVVISTAINQLKAMKAKEKLLGMHSKAMKIKFLTKTEEVGYNLALLNQEEQVELYQLMQKAKKREVLSEYKTSSKIETIEFEEVEKVVERINPLALIKNIEVEVAQEEPEKLTLEDIKRMFKK